MVISLGQIVIQIDLALISKIMVLILALLYAVFAVRTWVQVRRLESWLALVQGYGFSLWAMLHLMLALVGLVLVFFVL